jgi:hypothetical protein
MTTEDRGPRIKGAHSPWFLGIISLPLTLFNSLILGTQVVYSYQSALGFTWWGPLFAALTVLPFLVMAYTIRSSRDIEDRRVKNRVLFGRLTLIGVAIVPFTLFLLAVS